MKELDFTDAVEKEVDMLDYLTYSSIVAQVELYGMSWDDVKTLFGTDRCDAAKDAYKREMAEADIND